MPWASGAVASSSRASKKTSSRPYPCSAFTRSRKWRSYGLVLKTETLTPLDVPGGGCKGTRRPTRPDSRTVRCLSHPDECTGDPERPPADTWSEAGARGAEGTRSSDERGPPHLQQIPDPLRRARGVARGETADDDTYYYDGISFWRSDAKRQEAPRALLADTPAHGWRHEDDCTCDLCARAQAGAAAPALRGLTPAPAASRDARPRTRVARPSPQDCSGPPGRSPRQRQGGLTWPGGTGSSA